MPWEAVVPFDEAAHPRDATGQFTADTGPGREGKSVLGLRAKGASLPKEEKKGGGKGKGAKGKGKGDAEKKAKQARALQAALKRAGFTDADGKPLKADGVVGPKTIAAIKKAQKKFGMKPDGKITPALLRRLARPRMDKKHLAARQSKTLKAKPKAAPQKPRFAAGIPIGGQ